ncbi:hypothetical protein GCM10027062_38530 [Nocardioides hungaricus]
MTRRITTVDPFDLPDWLGEEDVTWSTESGLRRGYDVAGTLTGHDRAPVPCDLLAVDEAYPVPVADEQVRHDAHQAWRHGQVLVVEVEGRVTLAVPGTGFTADLVMDALSRLAKAVGASPDHYSVRLRIGTAKS